MSRSPHDDVKTLVEESFDAAKIAVSSVSVRQFPGETIVIVEVG
jgi:hypothetical protein